MPNITGKIIPTTSPSGSFIYTIARGGALENTNGPASYANISHSYSDSGYAGIGLNANKSNARYTDSGKVIPSSLHFNTVIKY